MAVIVVLIIGGSIAGFYNAQIFLTEYAKEVGSKIPKSDASSLSNQAAKQIKNSITQYQPTVDIANSLFATDQEKIIQSLGTIAASTNLSISDTKFRQPDQTELATTTLAGAKVNFAVISINTPTKYTDLIRFLKAIEGNVPKMLVTDLVINQTPGSTTNVQVNPITIEYYTK